MGDSEANKSLEPTALAGSIDWRSAAKLHFVADNRIFAWRRASAQFQRYTPRVQMQSNDKAQTIQSSYQQRTLSCLE